MVEPEMLTTLPRASGPPPNGTVCAPAIPVAVANAAIVSAPNTVTRRCMSISSNSKTAGEAPAETTAKTTKSVVGTVARAVRRARRRSRQRLRHIGDDDFLAAVESVLDLRPRLADRTHLDGDGLEL